MGLGCNSKDDKMFQINKDYYNILKKNFLPMDIEKAYDRYKQCVGTVQDMDGAVRMDFAGTVPGKSIFKG